MNTQLLDTKRGTLVNNMHVNELIENYKKNRWLDNSKKIQKSDSLSTWFGLEELESFFSLAKENNANGIKMFYGVYPENYPDHPELAGRQTIVLVATRSTKNESGITHKSISIHSNGKKEILAMNFGTICPPYCGGGTGGFGSNPITIETDNLGLAMHKIDGEIHII